MTEVTSHEWTKLAPPLRSSASRKSFLGLAKALTKAQKLPDALEELEALRESFVEEARTTKYVDEHVLLAAGLVLSDLAVQGWQLRIRQEQVEICPPRRESEDRTAEKARIRSQELVKRDAQLRQPAVKAFLEQMERNRLFGSKFVSIFSLMRDGRELAAGLREARMHRANGWADALSKVVDPYIDFVKSEASCCPHTGLRLMDVWRYFRHTWSNQYTSVPGRSMLFLVRDGASVFHPVIGIGAICSPIMQLRERDEWIGWQPDSFVHLVRKNPTEKIARWLEMVLDAAISEIYIADFVEEKILSVGDITSPSQEVIERLQEDGLEQRQAHHRFARQRDHKRPVSNSQEGWEGRARSHLFRSKRALSLATYLNVRRTLFDFGKKSLSADGLVKLADTPRGADAIRKVLRKAKADRVGICVADISVCGAIQPYNAILGGKLVSMLAASPEVAQEYRRRYSNAESEIASAMAGRAIRRPPNLVLIGTTSLYGVGSSQYNRLRIPAEKIGGIEGEELRYFELGKSEAFGTSQYSEETVEALTELAQQSTNGQRINSIFGEGVSPKLRKVRQGLDLLKMPSDILLRHHRHRIVYGTSLVRNLRDFLLGMDSEPEYTVPLDATGTTAKIGAWWRERWLRNRIESDVFLQEVERHTLVRPVKHGARAAHQPNKFQSMLFSEEH